VAWSFVDWRQGSTTSLDLLRFRSTEAKGVDIIGVSRDKKSSPRFVSAS
jgi:hypothetical protein